MKPYAPVALMIIATVLIILACSLASCTTPQLARLKCGESGANDWWSGQDGRTHISCDRVRPTR